MWPRKKLILLQPSRAASMESIISNTSQGKRHRYKMPKETSLWVFVPLCHLDHRSELSWRMFSSSRQTQPSCLHLALAIIANFMNNFECTEYFHTHMLIPSHELFGSDLWPDRDFRSGQWTTGLLFAAVTLCESSHFSEV